MAETRKLAAILVGDLIVTVIAAILGSFALTNWVILRLPYARRIF